MRNLKKNINMVMFTLFTILNFVLGIPIPEINDILGACSIVQLLLFAIGIENRIVFSIAIAYGVVFLVLLAWCIFAKRNKNVFMILLIVDILISIVLTIFKLFIKNYLSVDFMLLGVFIRIIFVIWNLRTQGDGGRFETTEKVVKNKSLVSFRHSFQKRPRCI